MITPLLTQLTYEGLIDELLGIKNCVSSLHSYLLTMQTDTMASACGAPCVAIVTTEPTGCLGIDVGTTTIDQCPSRVVEEGEQEEAPFDNIDRPTFCRTQGLEFRFCREKIEQGRPST